MNNIKIINHEVVDLDTGEILGPVVEAGAIANQDALELVLEQIQRQTSQVAAEQIRLRAIQEQSQKALSRKAGYLEYLKSVYTSPIEQYAKARLSHTGKKSIVTPYGTVAIRSSKGGLKVADEKLALTSVALAGFDNAIKITEKLLISELTDEQKEALKEADGFIVVGPSETVSIKTGVE
jgi:hypothetical protein